MVSIVEGASVNQVLESESVDCTVGPFYVLLSKDRHGNRSA